MRLSDIRKLALNLPETFLPVERANMLEHAKVLGLDTAQFHQKLEMDSYLVDTYRDVTRFNDRIQLHSHSFFEILFCRNTCGAEYLVGSERYKLQKGDLIFVSPGVSHRPILPPNMEEPYIRDVIWINQDFMENLCRTFHIEYQIRSALLRTAGTKWEYLGDLFRIGVMETEEQAPDWELAVLGNTISLLSYLGRAYSDSTSRYLPAETPELLDQVMAYVEDHLSEKISLAEVAKHFFVSESTITQTFRKKMGVSFYRCVTQRRLISAKSLIRDGLSLDAVAEQVGFSDYSSFFRAFKQEYGISPSQFKKQTPVVTDDRG